MELPRPLTARAGAPAERVELDRLVAEMLGLARGVLADGSVNAEEALALRRWQEANPTVGAVWPASALFERLDRIFADGRVDDEERASLAALLRQLADVGREARGAAPPPQPVDDPAPGVVFPGRVFTLTGTLAHGSTGAFERKVTERGGIFERQVTERTDFLVLGAYVRIDMPITYSPRHIDAALELRRCGRPIAIVSEAHWLEAVNGVSPPAA